MELTKNKITKFERIKNSRIWKGVYIALVAIISISYFIFSYFYIQEARFIEFGGREFEVKDKYMVYTVLQILFLYLFFLVATILAIRAKKLFFPTMFLFFLLFLSFLNYLIPTLIIFLK